MQMLECFGFGLAFMDMNISGGNTYNYKGTRQSCCYELLFVNYKFFGDMKLITTNEINSS